MTAAALILLFVPLPYQTVAEGIVWTRGEAGVFARTEGTVVALLSEPNRLVSRGDPLIQLEDPLLDAQVRVLEAAVRELELRPISVASRDPLQKQLFEEQLDRAKGDLVLHRKRQEDLVVRSPGDGRFVLRRPNELMGKFAHRGEILAFVAAFDRPIVKLVVTEDSLDLVRTRPELWNFGLSTRSILFIPALSNASSPLLVTGCQVLRLARPAGVKSLWIPAIPRLLRRSSSSCTWNWGFGRRRLSRRWAGASMRASITAMSLWRSGFIARFDNCS